jgi:hypothetical protein
MQEELNNFKRNKV